MLRVQQQRNDLTSGAYEIADLDVDDLCTARDLAARHPGEIDFLFVTVGFNA